MDEYKLANGGSISDEEIEDECAAYEAGTWEGRLEGIRKGGPTVVAEPLEAQRAPRLCAELGRFSGKPEEHLHPRR